MTHHKSRYSKAHEPFFLAMNEGLIMERVDPGKDKAHAVARILGEMGGECRKQSDLVDAVMVEMDCSEKSARGYVKQAVRARTIFRRSEGDKRSSGFSVEK